MTTLTFPNSPYELHKTFDDDEPRPLDFPETAIAAKACSASLP